MLEAVVPAATARLLGLAPGRRVTLGAETTAALGTSTGPRPVTRPVTVVVVGTFRPRSASGFEQDPTSGSGFDPAYSDGSRSAPAYGPFEVGSDALLASGSTLASLQVTGRPDLGAVSERSLQAAAARLQRADAGLSAAVGDRVDIERVASALPASLARLQVQQGSVRATVLVAVLLGLVLTVGALVLAARSTSVVRAEERALLVALGAGRGQLIAASATEAALLAVTATLVAVPASLLVHAWLTRRPTLAAAGLVQPLGWPATLLPTILLGAVLLGAVLVLSGTTGHGPAPADGRAVRATRSGLDLLLLVVVAASWWQLRTQPATATPGDTVQVLAPVAFLVAASVLVVRLVPPAWAVLARGTRRSRALLVPLAVLGAARRPGSVVAAVLLVAAVASTVFGLSLAATWERSQTQQAALRVGTDLTVALPAPPTTREASALARATGGRGAAVTAGPVALGRYVGDVGAAPTLVALDAARAGELLRGSPGGSGSWADLGRSISPARPVAGLPLPVTGVRLGGALTGGRTDVEVTPTLVVQGSDGVRRTVTAAPVRLDGRSHPLRTSATVATGQRLVAVQLVLGAAPGTALAGGDAGGGGAGAERQVSVDLVVPGEAAPQGAAWSAASLGQQPGPATGVGVALDRAAAGTTLRATATVALATLAYVDAPLVLTSFTPPTSLPVVVSQGLVDAVGAGVGDTFEVSVDGLGVPARVRAVVPAVPSAPGGVAVLADQDTLSRVLVASGRLEPTVDAWWVARPRADAAARVRALGLGTVVQRSQVTRQLAEGPLGVLVPTALLLLVVAAGALAVTGTGVRLLAELGTRTAETARLRALGLTRRTVTRLVVGQEAAVIGLLVALGALVGTGAAAALAPSLVRSDTGAAPLPPAELVWPWGEVVGVVLVLLAGCLVVTAIVSAAHVRRSEAALTRPVGP